jgi:hypothetical protein
MNWTKGLFRLWIVLALLWICTSGAIAAYIWRHDAGARSSAEIWAKHEEECGPPGQPKPGPWCDFLPAASRENPLPLGVYPAAIFGPPVLLFCLGWMGLWVASGFRGSIRPT